MDSGPLTIDELLELPFRIHSLNNYAYIGLTRLVDNLNLDHQAVRKWIRAQHHILEMKLKIPGIDYPELRNALVPKPGRHEAAFVFDSTRAGSSNYGHAFAERWIPVIKSHGPEKSVIRVGDILRLPNHDVWQELEAHLVGPNDFPRMARELYFAVYMTNLSPAQLTNIDLALAKATPGYLGYIDCSTWNPLKAGMYLPQVGLRLRDQIITDMDDGENSNQVGYPFDENGFQIVGIEQELYATFLGHRLDNGIPAWADQDSALALTVLGGRREPVSSTSVVIDATRIEYLKKAHGTSLNRSDLADLDKNELAESIERKFTNGLIYDLRFTLGTKAGVPTQELDALMYSVQVEFPDINGAVKRYQVGLKYLPNSDTSEVVTFY